MLLLKELEIEAYGARRSAEAIRVASDQRELLAKNPKDKGGILKAKIKILLRVDDE